MSAAGEMSFELVKTQNKCMMNLVEQIILFIQEGL